MNKHEFVKQSPFDNDMKRKFDDNTEFAKEFLNPIDDIRKVTGKSTLDVDDELLDARKKKARR